MSRLSSNQLTIIAVAGLLCFGLPAGALAAGVSKVAIASENGKTAKVAQGRLQVGATVTGTVPVTGSVTSTISGPVSTTVSGPVTAREADPLTFVHGHAYVNTTCQTVLTAPPGNGLVVKLVKVNTYQDPSPGDANVIVLYVGTSCVGVPIGDVNPATVGMTPMPFDPGLTLAPGMKLSAQAIGNPRAEVTADGYTVAPSAVPARPSLESGGQTANR